MTKKPDIDMSPEAVQRRLDKVGQLLRLCRELAKFQIVAPAK